MTFEELLSNAKVVYESKGLPGKKEEEYKYTNLTGILEKEFGKDYPLSGISGNKYDSADYLSDLDCYRILLVNGKVDSFSSDIPKGLDIKTFNTGEAPSEVAKLANAESNGYVALNTVNFQEGLQIIVSEKVQLEKPLFIIHINDVSEDKVISMPRLYVEFGKESKSEVYIGLFSSGDNPSFVNFVTEVVSQKASSGSITTIQNENAKALTHSTYVVKQERDSNFNSTCISLGGRMVRNNLEVILNDENIESHLYGLYQLSGNQHVDNHTVVDHKKPNSNSNELYKGVLNENATGVFNGKIYVRPDAQKTNAFQSNKNILLSDTASINTKPQLEIWADDVKCTHGCTTGQLDEEQIFYLQSRGVPKELAVKMVLRAFQHDIIDRINNEVVINYIDSEISKRIGAEIA